MQNLKDIDHRLLRFDDAVSPLTATAWDLNDDSLVCAFGPTTTDPLLSLKRLKRDTYTTERAETIAAWDALSPTPDLPCDKILDLHCFPDTRTLVLILAGGDIVTVREEPQPGEDAVEIVGSIDAGIAAAAWSPDEELILIVTNNNSALLMTQTFESTAEIILSLDDLKVSNHVSVGWGKTETQFKGRGAKALRDPTVPEHVDAGMMSERDTGRCTISWRGDGQYVAVNSILDSTPPRRVVRVFSRNGILDSVSEPVDNLEGALSWKPNGQTLAGVQRLADKAQVVFFERNGLRHGEFDLRFTQEELAKSVPIELKWNVDSTVLAVCYGSKAQMWTSSNYRWYLKQELRLESGQDLDTLLTWHSEKPLLIACGLGATLHCARYAAQYSLGSTSSPHDLGLVACIDGYRLEVTPLGIANVPPPMSYDAIDFTGNIIDVAFSKAGRRISVLHHDRISVLECDYEKKPPNQMKLIETLSTQVDTTDTGLQHRQLMMAGDQTYKVLSIVSNECTSRLCAYSMAAGQKDAEKTAIPLSSRIFTTDLPGCQLYHNDGTISQPDSTTTTNENLPASCTSVDIWRKDDHTILFGLSSSGVLHIRSSTQQIKVPGCTSFLVADSYLIYTTSQHVLKFVHLHLGELELPANEPEEDERCRSVERGAKIVTAMPSSFALVLQMPRGNLETIYPRALVLAGIRRRITERDYKRAFFVCRSHRVDMNILYDYAPQQFLTHVELFIKQIRKAEHIDLFLSSLSQEDTSQTIYRETLRAAAQDSQSLLQDDPEYMPKTESKVNLICDAFLSCLQKNMPTTLQNLITAHVSKNPPDLEAGLKLLAAVRKSGSEDELEQAVEHICFLADVNQLYDTALGLYELEVTLLIAQQSQKDPREYLPYLQSLQGMEAKRRHFTIDNDLKRYAKALASLRMLDAFEELVAYTEKHQLYTTAIEMYRHDKRQLVDLTRLYAEYLLSRNEFSKAAFLFDSVQEYTGAFEAYRSAGLWRETLTNAAMIDLSEVELTSLATTMAEGQEEAKDFTAAAVIHLDYLRDVEGAVRLYCKAYNFAEAMRLSLVQSKRHLLADVVDPGLIECSASMTELLAEMKGQVNAQVPRLRELRQKKLEEPMAYLNAAEGEDGDIPDNLSVAPTDASTSGGTFMTRYTNRSSGTVATNATRKTSKNRRREERKRAKGKKGTVYEEEYLVNSITRLIERLKATSEDITKLVQGLMRRGMRERAVAVENAMADVWQLCKQHMAEVYEIGQEKPVTGRQLDDQNLVRSRPWGGQGVLWDSINAAQGMIKPPELIVFARSGLLPV